MQNTNLYQTILTLTPVERKHFDQWIRSAFFNKKLAPVALWDYISDCLDKKILPDPEKACQKITAAEPPYKRKEGALNQDEIDQAFRLVVSALLDQLEHFLVYKSCFTTLIDVDLTLANQYRQRGLDKHFDRSMAASRKHWEKQPFRHAEYFEAKANVEYEQYQYSSTKKRTEVLNLQALSDATDMAFIARKLRLACFALSHQTVFKTEYNLGLLPLVLSFVEERPSFLEIPAIGLYYRCYQLIRQPDNDAPFGDFKTDLLANMAILPLDEQRNLHLFAINFCVRRINRSETAWYRAVLDLYQSALKAELLIENGVLSQFAYNNITAIALKTKELDWAENFVKEYAHLLEKKYSGPAFHLNMARVAYSKSNHREALIHLQEADYKDLINNLIAKTLQLKIYYEIKEFDALEAHIQSMKTYLSRQRNIGYHKTNYQQIIKYAQRLLRCNLFDRKSKEQLRQAIAAEPVLTEKEWFLSQLA